MNFPNADSMEIRVLSPLTGLVEFPYVVEQGRRLEIEPQPLGGIFLHVAGTGTTLVTRLEAYTKEAQRWILVDGAARDELGDEFSLTPLGEQMLKGKSESIRVFAVDN